MKQDDQIDETALERLIPAFYTRVRADADIGPLFNDAVHDWPDHLERLVAFWSSVMLTSGRYKGSPMAAHLKHRNAITPAMFDRWLAMFRTTVDDLFEGENAAHIKRCAEDMANVIHAKINSIPDPRFDPANLTDEQRQRYAQYKSQPNTP